jgi:integrase/recombinase XerD
MAKSNKVTVYVRVPGTRERERATNKNTVPTDTVYCLRYVRAGKHCWETLDVTSFAEAQKVAIDRNVALVVGKPVPIPEPRPEPVKPKPTVQTGAVPLDVAIDLYNANCASRSGKTVSGYAATMKQFYASCRKPFVQDVTQQDLIDFVKFLRATGVGDRTISNRLVEVTTFLRASGVKDITLGHKFTEKIGRSYLPDELQKLFAAANEAEWLMFQFYLCSGGREQEVEFAEWDSLDFTDSVFHIRETAEFKPKDYEEREIPLPDFLMKALKERLLHSTGRLIFPTAAGRPDGHMLRRLQALAQKAGITTNAELHKFRKTYATLQHKAGVDARTIQKRLGHADLATTLAYLEGEDSRSERSRSQVNDTFACFA